MSDRKSLFERALKTDPAQIGHYLQGGYMSPKIKPVSEDMKVIGPAFPIRLPGTDNASLYVAMKQAPKGSVIVIDRMGDQRIACIGEIATLSAKNLGMAGIVIDGPNTDTMRIKEMGLPVFSTGRTAVANTFQGLNGEFNVTINCGGAVVKPGDIIYGDIDGVVVAPADQFEELVEKAEAADKNEALWKEKYKEGGYITDFVNLDRLVEEGIQGKIGELLKKD